jgi:hypothetical protein
MCEGPSSSRHRGPYLHREPKSHSLGLDRYIFLIPAALAVVLCIPVLDFTYTWDDYNFLTNAIFYQLLDRLPISTDPFLPADFAWHLFHDGCLY